MMVMMLPILLVVLSALPDGVAGDNDDHNVDTDQGQGHFSLPQGLL